MAKVIFSLLLIITLMTTQFGNASEVTYTHDVAPILFKNCVSCHRPGEVGPFSLLSYEEAAKRAEFIAEIVAEKKMPPWKAVPHYGTFDGERLLTDTEIETFKTWAATGTRQGKPEDLPAPPTFTEGWHLGEPDLVVKMSEAFTIPADGRDIYRCFTIPLPIDENKTVSAIEFRPGNKKVVHHAILYLDAMGQGRKKEKQDGQPGFESFGGPGIIPTGGLGAWVPGAFPGHLPPDTGRFLRQGSDLILQIHYHPNGKVETDQSTIGIYFNKEPAKNIVVGMAIRSRKLNIPAGAKRHYVEASSDPLPANVQVVTIGPHMHLLGREMKLFAETPNGEIPLVWIKDWDFNWQGAYQYKTPLALPKGTVIKLQAYYDNSSDNPFNPNSPPKAVRWGEQTTDEMCLCSLSVITENRADLLKIASMSFAELGMGIGGGLPDDSNIRDRWRKQLADHGFPIPARFRDQLTKFDTDNDGRLTTAEIDQMPADIKYQVNQALDRILSEKEAKPK
jgi:hypothetical protein